MIHIIISAYGEPKSTEKAVNTFLNQNIKDDFKIIVMDPFPDVKKYLLEKFKDVKEFEFFDDPGEGKSFALNLLLSQIYTGNKNDLIISTDGDVYVGENAVNSVIDYFKDEKIGAACGRVVSLNSRNNMYGFWSHLFFDEMNKTRKKLTREGKFFEFSGYVLAFRNGVITEFPLDSSEDKVIPAVFYNKGYKLGFIENAEVYVLNPQNFKDWIGQKKRNLKGHINLKKAVKHEITGGKKYGLFGEALRGIKFVFSYVKTPKEFVWMVIVAFARLYVWFSAYWDIKFKKKKYSDGWRGDVQSDSTRPLD